MNQEKEKMIRCSCGLIIASSKLRYHLEAEHWLVNIDRTLRDLYDKEGLE